MLKKYRPYIILFYILSAASLIAAAFIDLELDIKVNDPENPFAIWFQNTGEIPSRLICPLAGTIIYITGKNTFERIAGVLFALGGSAYFGYYFSYYFFRDENQLAFGIIYGIGFGIVCLAAGKYIKIPDEKCAALKYLAVIGIIVMFVQLGIIDIMKVLWGRVRFRDLIAAGSYDDFTKWYKMNGINGNKSFPSGHTAGAGMSYLKVGRIIRSTVKNGQFALTLR